MSDGNFGLPGQAMDDACLADGGMNRNATGNEASGARWKARLRAFWLSGTAMAGLSAPVFAKDIAPVEAHLFTSFEAIASSLVLGVISAALFSAIWLIRQKGTIESESREVRSALSLSLIHI